MTLSLNIVKELLKAEIHYSDDPKAEQSSILDLESITPITFNGCASIADYSTLLSNYLEEFKNELSALIELNDIRLQTIKLNTLKESLLEVKERFCTRNTETWLTRTRFISKKEVDLQSLNYGEIKKKLLYFYSCKSPMLKLC